MRVELLFWDGCPSHPKALAELRQAVVDVALDPSTVVVREVETRAEAALECFVGSPTIRIDRVDVQRPGEEPVGLTPTGSCTSWRAGRDASVCARAWRARTSSCG